MLHAYRERLPHYEEMKHTSVAFIADLVGSAHLNIHHITGRVKKPVSLQEKLARKPGRYTSLDEVTDVVAVRVITYFESDVWQVSRLLEKHFDVDWDNSVDKSKLHDPDRFGYMGVHYVVRFPPRSAGTPEHLTPFVGTWFEVQIRSILQHAWAEIEHDLGYKSQEAVPREIRRRFYRLAGLLEMADEEFMAIRNLKANYAETLPARIATNPNAVYLDAQSVQYLLRSGRVPELDWRIAQRLGVRADLRVDDDRVQRITAALKYVRVNSAGQLLNELERREQDVVDFAARLMPQVQEAWSARQGLKPGVSLVNYALWKACYDDALDAPHVVDLLDLRAEVGGAERLARLAQLVYADLHAAEQRPGEQSPPLP